MGENQTVLVLEKETLVNENVILRPIPSNRGLSNYLADTENGRIWSKKSNKFLSSTPNDNGYVYNSLIDDNGEKLSVGVHRLIMASESNIPLEHFKRGEIEVDHYPNEDEKWNNSVHNLQISDRKSQYRESTRAKMGKGSRLTEEQVCEILSELEEWIEDDENKVSDFIWKCVEKYNQGYRNLYNIIYGKTWRKLHNKHIYINQFGVVETTDKKYFVMD